MLKCRMCGVRFLSDPAFVVGWVMAGLSRAAAPAPPSGLHKVSIVGNSPHKAAPMARGSFQEETRRG